MKLTQRRVDKLTTPGRYADGGTLHLVISPSGAKSWVQRVTIRDAQRRRVDRGLGSCKDVSLADARELAYRGRQLARKGQDPRGDVQTTAPTFADAFRTIQDRRTLLDSTTELREGLVRRYCGSLATRPINTIRRADVIDIVGPMYAAGKASSGKKVRSLIREVLAFGIAYEHMDSNAADNIDGALPVVTTKVKHHDALPYEDVPRFYQALTNRPADRALKLIILTGCRKSEAANARWEEVNLATKTWTIHADRMGKTKTEHAVPLSDEAIAVLGTPHPRGYVFAGRKDGTPVSAPAIDKAKQRLCGDCTVHGFRSSFRQWAKEETDYSRAVCEHALSHTVGNAVERAYTRDATMVEKRRALMSDWSSYIGLGQ